MFSRREIHYVCALLFLNQTFPIRTGNAVVAVRRVDYKWLAFVCKHRRAVSVKAAKSVAELYDVGY